MRDNTRTKPKPSLSSTLLRIGKLDTLTGVRQEMARIYRASRRGEMSTTDLTRFVFALQAIARVISNSDLEQRIRLLEARDVTPPANEQEVLIVS
jgi:hypothetical protein